MTMKTEFKVQKGLMTMKTELSLERPDDYENGIKVQKGRMTMKTEFKVQKGLMTMKTELKFRKAG